MAAASEPPCKRARVDEGSTADEDRLSNLPDDLLHDILALVGSRQAVQTSVLSRRWRDMWRDVRCIDIDQQEFSGEAGFERFEDFADIILSPTLSGVTAAPLEAFRLQMLGTAGYTNLQRWIRRALRRNPASVDVHVDYGGAVAWPPSISLGSGAGASRLKRLHLFGVHLQSHPPFSTVADKQWLAQLWLPVLEDLHMEKCRYWGSTIVCSNLKSLVVVHRSTHHHPFTITSPCVASLRLSLPFGRAHATEVRISPENKVLASLVSASITVVDTDHPPRSNKNKLDFLSSTRSMLDRFPNVRHLDLSGFTTTALLDKESAEFPMFNGLRTLLLDGCDLGVSSYVLRSVLCNAPNLQHLRLHRCKFVGKAKRKQGTTKTKRQSSSTCVVSPSSLCKSLQFMEIKSRPEDNAGLHITEILKEILRGVKWEYCKRSSNEGTRTVLLRMHRTSLS